MELTLYTRAGCHLCEEMKRALGPLLREFHLPLREVDIDADPALAARFGEEIPVLFFGEHKVAKFRMDVKQLRLLFESKTKADPSPACRRQAPLRMTDKRKRR